MSQYDWRKEREKYKVHSQTAPDAVTASESRVEGTGQPKKGGVLKVAVVVAVLLLLAIVALMVWMVAGRKEPSAENKAVTILVSNKGGGGGKDLVVVDSARQLQEASSKHQHAVGLVVFWAKLQNGSIHVDPVGTAWACAPDKFATNAHVAKGIRNSCQELLLELGCRIILAEIEKEEAETGKAEKSDNAEQEDAQAKTVKPEEKLLAYKNKIGDDAFEKKLTEAMNLALKNLITDMGTEIRINQKNNVSVPVTMVQVHRKYGMPDTNFDPDVAMLTVSGKVDDYFPLAKGEDLKAMKQGMPIAFLGFPMENLFGDNVNLETPGATMQTGIISAMSDFDLKDVGFEGNYLIRHNLPMTGGASGSPLFNTDGEVVALMFGGNMEVKKSLTNRIVGRAPHAAQVNFAVRVDLLDGMGEPVPVLEWLLRD